MKKLTLFLTFLLISFTTPLRTMASQIVEEEIIIDSNISLEEALIGTEAPKEIIETLEIIDVEYYSIDGKLHRGQLVIDRVVKKDILAIFQLIKEEKFPVVSVIPIKFDRPNGNSSMAHLNNTYAFHYRLATGKQSLSNHSYGRAIDINPYDNTYISRSGKYIPEGATYTPESNTKALGLDNSIVQEFLKRGWSWGGLWVEYKDYMHFDKNQGSTYIDSHNMPQAYGE